MFYGAQYYRPPFPGKECWQRDFENMKFLGFNCVKLWAVWNWIEKEPGVFDFTELDQLVAHAKNNGLKVIINTIPEGAPYWTYTGSDDDLYQTADGQRVAYGGPANIPSGGWPGLCMDNPDFSGLVAHFIEKTASHFSTEEAIAAIDVWNEPHLEPMYDYRNNMLCYCKHSKRAFTEWLQKKYKTLEVLNSAWYRTYTNWAQVAPPPRFGTWADMLDWRKFWLENLNRWLKIRVDACRRGAPNIKTQTHVAYSGILGNKIIGGLANELGDEFLLAKEVDIFGLSSFPKWLMGSHHIYRHFLHNEMVAEASHGKPFYQVELQGGAGKPGLLGGEVPSALDTKLWNWNTVAAGGKGSVYWQYAAEPSGVESPGFGLTGFQGENTPRSLSAAECASILNNPLLDKASKVSATNAVYVSRHSDLLCFASERREEMYAGGLSGAFKAAYTKCIPIRFFHEDHVEELLKTDIKMLYLPMALILSEKEISVFKRFVEEGGTLVSEACPGLYRQDGLLEQEGIALRELFGLGHIEIQSVPEWGEISASCIEGNKPFTGRFYRQLVKPIKQVEILARFDDQEPALSRYKYGKGQAIWIGTYLAYHYETTQDDVTGDLITRWMDKGGYKLFESITSSPIANNEISLAPVVRLLSTESENILIILNHSEQLSIIEIVFSEHQKLIGPEFYGKNLTLHLKPGECKMLSWEK